MAYHTTIWLTAWLHSKSQCSDYNFFQTLQFKTQLFNGKQLLCIAVSFIGLLTIRNTTAGVKKSETNYQKRILFLFCNLPVCWVGGSIWFFIVNGIQVQESLEHFNIHIQLLGHMLHQFYTYQWLCIQNLNFCHFFFFWLLCTLLLCLIHDNAGHELAL